MSGPEFAVNGRGRRIPRKNAADYSFYLRNAYSKRQFAKKAIEI
jgi:hypothetical protein